jgi:lysozyme
MNLTKKGLEFIKEFEGCKLKAYLCPAKVWTIGWGNTEINGVPVKKGDTITQEQADDLLLESLKPREEKLNELLGDSVTKPYQFDALMSFAYNMGLGALANSTLLKKHKWRAWGEASAQFLMWGNMKDKTGHLVHSEGLYRRRNREMNMYEKGDYDAPKAV